MKTLICRAYQAERMAEVLVLEPFQHLSCTGGMGAVGQKAGGIFLPSAHATVWRETAHIMTT